MTDLKALHPMDEPMHQWFGLSYSAYLIFARSCIQSMPAEWQARMVALIEEMQAKLDVDSAPNYTVIAREGRRFIKDPFRDYERGHRRIPDRRHGC